MSKIGYHYINGLITILMNGSVHEVSKSHSKFRDIVAVLKNEANASEDSRVELLSKLLSHASVAHAVQALHTFGYEDIKVDHGVVTVKGVPLHNSLTKRILELAEAGLPFDPFVKFLANVSENPSQESREALFDFLDQGKFPLTEDGCFLGYKAVVWGKLPGVEGKVLVDKHSKSFNMSVGQEHSMPWDAVDNNRNQACGAGFHVGTAEHARMFGGDVMIVVKVNPRDCVSVPRSDTTKLRCCRYKVVSYFEKYGYGELNTKVFSDATLAAAPTIEAVDTVPVVHREDFSTYTRDQLVRMAASRGITRSVTEGRELGKDLLVRILTDGKLDFDALDVDVLASLAVRRQLFSTVENAKKAGRRRILAALDR